MKTSVSNRPPFIGIKILKLIYASELFDDVYGDLHEIYIDRIEEKGLVYARFYFWLDVFMSVRNYGLRKKIKVTQNNSFAMFKNYFKITMRNIAGDKMYSALNIMGLALGIAAFIFILQYVSYEKSYDKFHSNVDNIYRVRYMVYRSGDLNIDCAAAVPRVGPFMKEKMPEVVDFARAFPMEGVFAKDQITFRENRVHIADPSFLKIFDFKLIRGDLSTILNAKDQVVLTESAAKKYFGKTDVVGERLEFHSWVTRTLEVVGVTEDVPHNSHIKYDFLISYETLNDHTRNEEGVSASETAWGWYDFNTYVSLRDGTDPKEFDRKFKEAVYQERKEDFEKYDFRSEFPLQPIADIHLYSNLLQESEPEEQGDGQSVALLSIIAVFILLIAWINYINLSTARASKRAKEVGIRKTMGAYRKQLIYQFLSEAFVLNFMSLILGITIVLLGIKYFNQLTNSMLSVSFLMDAGFWLTGIGIFVLGVVLSGLYPAFVLSGFKPSEVLKGKFAQSNRGIMLRKVLVTFQFAASISLIAGTIIVFQQLRHMHGADLGFELGDKMVVKNPSIFQVDVDSLNYNIAKNFKNDLVNNAFVKKLSISSNVPGDEIYWTNGIRKQEDTRDKNRTTYIVSIDHNYFDLYNIEVVAGSNFQEFMRSDSTSIIVNETQVKELGFNSPEEAIQQKVNFRGEIWQIVGVVEDYHQMSVKNKVSPLTFVHERNEFNFLTLSLNTENYKNVIQDVEASYLEFFPGNPFDFFFLDDFFNRQYVNETTFSKVFTLFAGFAIIVACLGLFGLASFSAAQKTKEIGVRKVLGAKVDQIVVLLTKEFVIIIALANLIAWPSIYFVMEGWLSGFASRISVSIFVLIASGILVLIIALVTVSFQTIKTAQSNPVKALRYE